MAGLRHAAHDEIIGATPERSPSFRNGRCVQVIAWVLMTLEDPRARGVRVRLDDRPLDAAVPSGLRLRRMLKAKIHRIGVTDAELHYPGSLSLGSELIEAADLVPYEEVDVVNVNNGARFCTYVMVGTPGECRLNGAAARLGVIGDLLIVMAFDLVSEALVGDWRPRIVHVDERNCLVSVDEAAAAAR